MYTFPVAFIVLKQQFPTRPDMDAMPDIMVIFAIILNFKFYLFPRIRYGLLFHGVLCRKFLSGGFPCRCVFPFGRTTLRNLLTSVHPEVISVLS